MKIFKLNLSVQLLLLFGLVILFGSKCPLALKSSFYALSLSLKEGLLFVLPAIMFLCVFNSMVENQGRAFRFVGLLLIGICLSNFLSILAAFGAGLAGLSQMSFAKATPIEMLSELKPLWVFPLPHLISNEIALLLGLALGTFSSLFRLPYAKIFGQKGNAFVTVFLQKIFIPLLPLFSLGFILKMQHEGLLGAILREYAALIFLIFFSILFYIGLMFAIVARFSFPRWLQYLKNVLPVGILGFSTMSSLATMPVTLNAAEKNTEEPTLVRAIIPATVNIHMIGDSIGLPLLAMAVLLSFGAPLPSFPEYLVFTGIFMLTKFAIPGVPCGTILVMIPILEKYLGFNSEMSAFMTAIYILFDSILTMGNVLGNSALVIFLVRLMKRSEKSPLVAALS